MKIEKEGWEVCGLYRLGKKELKRLGYSDEEINAIRVRRRTLS